MALGYTIASILKRSSHVFSDERASVKTDWLEQLNRKYVQVYFSWFIYMFSLLYLTFGAILLSQCLITLESTLSYISFPVNFELKCNPVH